MKTLISGVIWIIFACWFWYYLVGNPLDELALITRARVAPGFIVDTFEDVEDSEDGRAHWYHKIMYTYCLPDGREFTQTTRDISGRLKEEYKNLTSTYPIEVKYLPDNPTVSRLKGMGSVNLTDWLWRKVGLGSFFFILLVSPGITLILNGVSAIKREKRQSPIGGDSL